VYYYWVLEYGAGSQNVDLEEKDQECVVGSQDVGKDQERVGATRNDLGSERAA
jgi:hypothetical protein